MRSTDFTYKSNLAADGKRRWCRKHPTGFWGKRTDGQWYDKCTKGNKFREECEAVDE